MQTDQLSPAEIRAALQSVDEVALVDVREQRPYGKGHPLMAINIPLSRLESDLSRLIPANQVHVIFYGDNQKQAELAVSLARDLGYRKISILQDGLAAWSTAGLCLFSGTHVLGAAMAETLQRQAGVNTLSVSELVDLQESGKPVVVLDSRPWPNYLEEHIPGAIDCPLGELAYRIHDLVPDHDCPVVVNCAGRTRSILGVQSLLNIGLANPVYSLQQGTYGWWQAGYSLASGDGPRADFGKADRADQAFEEAHRVARKCGVIELDSEQLETWQAQASTRCLFMLDVRWEEEFYLGHAAGAISAPGGQLVECSEDWIGVRNGRILLLDNDGARARMTGSWLRQLGYPDVAVLDSQTSLPMNETSVPITPPRVKDPYYPEPLNELERMQRKKRYMDWQISLPDEMEKDGLISLQPLRV